MDQTWLVTSKISTWFSTYQFLLTDLMKKMTMLLTILSGSDGEIVESVISLMSNYLNPFGRGLSNNTIKRNTTNSVCQCWWDLHLLSFLIRPVNGEITLQWKWTVINKIVLTSLQGFIDEIPSEFWDKIYLSTKIRTPIISKNYRIALSQSRSIWTSFHFLRLFY